MEPEPAGKHAEDGTVEYFVQLLSKMKIKPGKAREYAESLVAQGYDEELFNDEGEEALQRDFGFLKGDAKRVTKHRAGLTMPATAGGGSAQGDALSAPADAIQLRVKTSSGTISVTADHGLATTVAQMRAKIAAASSVDVAACRLIFAGQELADSMSLAEYNCQNNSELYLILRISEPAVSDVDGSAADAEAERQTATMRAQMEGKKLADFDIIKKIGGKDITAAGGAGYSQSGVCSYVYLAQLRGGDRMPLAIKVMLNYTGGTADTVAINQEFDAETALLSDPVRLPAHSHVMVVLRSFADLAAGLPGWDFEADIVNPRTMFVVMPYFPEDLKRVLASTRRQGQQFGDRRSVRIVHQLLLAVHHLKMHGVVHRDLKPDNILIANDGTEGERAVVTDFGMCCDLRKNGIADYKVRLDDVFGRSHHLLLKMLQPWLVLTLTA